MPMARVYLSAGAVMETKIVRTAAMRAIVKASRGRVTPKPSSLAKAQVSISVSKERDLVTFCHCCTPDMPLLIYCTTKRHSARCGKHILSTG